MRYRIVATTDGRFVGHEFDMASEATGPLDLPEGHTIPVDFKMQLPDGMRLGNTNYIIDAVGID